MKLYNIALISFLLVSPLVADEVNKDDLSAQVVSNSNQSLDTITNGDHHNKKADIIVVDSNNSQQTVQDEIVVSQSHALDSERFVVLNDGLKNDVSFDSPSSNSIDDRPNLNTESIESNEIERRDVDLSIKTTVMENNENKNLSEKDDVEHQETSEESDSKYDESAQAQTSENTTSQDVANEKISEKSVDEEQTPKTVFVDYANKSTGALILDKAKNFQGTSNLLLDDKDRYAMIPCSEKSKYVIVGLSEDILVKSLKLSSFERYSSLTKQFQVLGSQTYPVMTEWEDLGSFEAKPWFKENKEQIFELKRPSWARYLKFRFLSHYGDEHYCTITQIKVHGSTTLQGFHEMQLEMEAEQIENTKASLDTEESLQDSDESVIDDVVVDSEISNYPEPSNNIHVEVIDEYSEDIVSNYENMTNKAQNDGDSTEDQSAFAEDNTSEESQEKCNQTILVPETNLTTSINSNSSGSSLTTTTDALKSNINPDSSYILNENDSEVTEATKHVEVEEIKEKEESIDSISTPLVNEIMSSATDSTVSAKKKTHSLVTEAVKAAIASVRNGSTTSDVKDSTLSSIVSSENEIIVNDCASTSTKSTSEDLKSSIPQQSPEQQLIDQGESPVDETADKKLNSSTLKDDDINQEKLRITDETIQNQTNTILDEVIADPSCNSNTKSISQKTESSTPENASSDSKDMFRRLAAEYSNSDCLKSLDFQEFKKKAMKAMQIQKGSVQGAASQMPKNEPIFKKLTDEIKVLQTSQSIYEQYVKAVTTCYESVISRMGKHIQSIEENSDQRLSMLEEKIQLILLEKTIPNSITTSNETCIENDVRQREEIKRRIQRCFSIFIQTLVFIYNTISDSTSAYLADDRVQKSIELMMGYKRDVSIFMFGFLFCFLFTNRVKRFQNSMEVQNTQSSVSGSNVQEIREIPIRLPALQEDMSMVYSFRSDDRSLDGENEVDYQSKILSDKYNV